MKNQTKEEPKAINYGQHVYWDERYSKVEGERFEWLQNFQNLQVQIGKLINYNKDCRILHIGCGNSAIQDYFYDEGYRKITNIDISSVVIAQMNKIKQEKGYHQMVYQVMDIRNMTYQDQSFNLIIDKSTIDSIMCTDNPITNVAKMMDQCYRVLSPNGIYFILSYASAATRLEHITRDHVNWDVQIKEVFRFNQQGQKLVHYAYICTKLPLKEERKTKEWREEYFKHLKKLQQQQYS